MPHLEGSVRSRMAKMGMQNLILLSPTGNNTKGPAQPQNVFIDSTPGATTQGSTSPSAHSYLPCFLIGVSPQESTHNSRSQSPVYTRLNLHHSTILICFFVYMTILHNFVPYSLPPFYSNLEMTFPSPVWLFLSFWQCKYIPNLANWCTERKKGLLFFYR